MIAKSFEIRDRGTFIPVMGIQMRPGCERDRYLFARAGYGTGVSAQSRYIILVRIDGGDVGATHDPFKWASGPRTMPTAHQFIVDHFDELPCGAVVDVEHILGETPAPKASEACS